MNEDQVVTEEADEEVNKAVLERVRSSEEYLESLRILLPAINKFSAHALRVVDELEKEKRTIVTLLEQAIDKKYGSVIAFEREMRRAKNMYYNTTIALSNYVITHDEKYIQEMRDPGMLVVNDALRGKKSLSSKELLNLHKIITKRMAAVNENYKYMKPDYDDYFASLEELKRIIEAKEDGIKEARLTFIIWGRAYQKMALGKTSQAEWFDISESGGLLMGAAGRAVGI